jgi:hypothetical protein
MLEAKSSSRGAFATALWDATVRSITFIRHVFVQKLICEDIFNAFSNDSAYIGLQ